MSPESRLNTAFSLMQSALQELDACRREISLLQQQPAAPMQIEEREYTIAEFCELERISRSTLFQWWKEGRGPRRREYGPRTIKIASTDIEEWRRSRAQAPAFGDAQIEQQQS